MELCTLLLMSNDLGGFSNAEPARTRAGQPFIVSSSQKRSHAKAE